MSFISTFKNILGIGAPEGEDLGVPQHDVSAPAVAVAPIASDTKPKDVVASPEMVHMIFDRVVEITNSAVPAYFGSSLNVEKQKKYLYDALDASVKDYIAALETAANEKCMAIWQKERSDLQRETENLKQRARDLESKRSEMKEQNLSAERQKRALSERVHDLEAKLLQLEAEKEQLDLENHSLVNKIKVANVQGADVEELRQQIEDLKKGASPTAINEENEALKKQIDELNQTVKSLTDACEAAKMKDAMNGTMLNDLQHRSSESLKAAQDAQAEVESLKKEAELKDARIDDLQKELDEKTARLQEDEEALEDVQQIVEQMDLFEKVKSELEKRIRELKHQLKQAERDNDTLRTTIKNNLYAHAQQQKELQDQIDQLKVNLAR